MRVAVVPVLVFMGALVCLPAIARADCGMSALRAQQAALVEAVSLPYGVDDAVQGRGSQNAPRLLALTKINSPPVVPCPEYTGSSEAGQRFVAAYGLFTARLQYF